MKKSQGIAVATAVVGAALGAGTHAHLTQPGRRAPELYPAVHLDMIAGGHWVRPRAEVTGRVALVRREDDGDIHIRIDNGSPDPFIVAEIIPELAQVGQVPQVGQVVTVRGVVRYDGEHRWWEIHPVTWIGPAK